MIKQYFIPFADDIQLETWRNPPAPLAPYQPFLNQYRHKKHLHNKTTHILDIRVKCKYRTPYYYYPRLTDLEKLLKGIRYRGLHYYVNVLIGEISKRFTKFTP
jgi:hypothetical protein